MRYYVLCLAFSSLILNSFSQTVIKGRVLNRATLVPVAYVNIGIPASSAGTVSNEDGTFSIQIPKKHSSDTLIFSALGFTKIQLPLSTLINTNDLVIKLKENVVTLESVVVTARKEKQETFSLGNKYTRGGFLYADSISAGAAMALLIDNKFPSYYSNLSYPVYLEEVSAYINKNSLPGFKVRVRILAHDSVSGLPGQDLLKESVIITSSVKRGWIKIDLRPYRLKVYQRFFLMLEWIMDDSDRLALLNQYAGYRKSHPEKVRKDSTIVNGEKIGFWSYDNFSPGTHLGVSPIPFSLQNYTCYYRTHSFDTWKTAPVILTARVLVSNQPSKDNRHALADTDLRAPEYGVDKLCNDFLSETSVNGFQIAVMKNGKIAFAKGYGYADTENGKAVTNNTRFKIGSISKPVTAAALIKLTKENKLDLDKPVNNYLPTLSHLEYPITTRQLAGHLAGIRHYKNGDINDLVRHDHYSSATAALRIIEQDTLLFKPGEEFHYSSFGWNIIGALIEKVSRHQYLAYMNEYLWKPLELTSMSGALKDSICGDCSKGYLATGEAFDEGNLSYKHPSGGLISTSKDLAVFGNKMLALMNDPASTPLFTTMHLNDGTETKYGMGWNIGEDYKNHRIFFHSGNMINGSGFLVLYPDDNLVIALLSNGPEGLTFDVQKIAEFFYQSEK